MILESGSYDPNKDIMHGGRNKIVDGSGCYITRNSYDSMILGFKPKL